MVMTAQRQPASPDLKPVLQAAAFVRMLRLLSADMPMQQAEVLIQIALHPEGVNMSDLGKKTRLSPASISRNIGALSVYNKPDKPGLGLIDVNIDPVDPRRRIASLTQKGKTFITKLVRTLSSDFTIDEVTDLEVMMEQQAEDGLKASINEGHTRGKIGSLRRR